MGIIALLEPHFQPIVSVQGHYAYEALMRLRGSTTAPPRQMAAWERSGFISVMDRAMVRKVALILANKPGRHRVAVNVSAKTLEVAPAEYLAELDALRKVAKRVIVEITETYPIANVANIAEFAAKCVALSMYVALDDCKPETPFFDLDFIKTVRPNFLKVDGQFLAECHAQGRRAPVLEVVRRAGDVNAAVIAEWIDSDAKRAYAASLGAPLLQGYWFGRPGVINHYQPPRPDKGLTLEPGAPKILDWSA